jgi:hypothetical protein
MEVETRDGTGKDFVEHWTWAADRGLLNRDTARGLKAAVLRVLKIEGDDWEAIDVRSMDEDGLLDRFEVLEKKGFTPDSLSAYRSRFKKARALYLSYLENPRGYKPTFRAAPERADKGDGAPTKPKKTKEPTVPPDPLGTGPKMIRYPFPVRSGVMAELLLPVDLQKSEAKRLSAFMESVAAEPTLMLPPKTDVVANPN